MNMLHGALALAVGATLCACRGQVSLGGELPSDAGAEATAVGSSGSGGGSSSGSGSNSSGGGTSSSGGTTGSGVGGHAYAIRTLYLGETDRQGVPSSTAWQSFGSDLDGLVTNASSTDVCTLIAGASKSVQIDGNGGIDNSWGANVVPILVTLTPSDFSQSVNASIQAGGPTQLLYVVGFDDSAGNTTTAAGLSGLWLDTVQFSNPTWNTSTHWPIAPEYMNGCELVSGCPTGTDPIQQAQIRFPQASQRSGTFVSGAPTDLWLQIPVFGQPLGLYINDAVVTFAPQAPGAVTNGTIAGVLDVGPLIMALQEVAGHVSTSLCSNSAFQSIALQIQQTADIVHDVGGSGGISNGPGVMCNAISIGLGFDATEIAVPTAADVAGPQPNGGNPTSGCGDGG